MTLKNIFTTFAILLLISGQVFAQTNVSQGKSSTASSVQGANVPGNANNGVATGARWAASDATFPQWWRVDLGSSHTLTHADINWYSTTARAYKYKIEVSADDATYNTVVNKTGNITFGDTSDTFSATGRYVRVTVTGANAGFASAYEISIFGTPAVSAPSITSTLTASGTVGTAFSYQIMASNSPTSYKATGLPADLSINTSTGLISGTPTAAGGPTTVAISATNAGGTGNANLAVTINAAPLVPPAVPTGLTATPNSTSQITVTWNPVAGATGYDLQRDGVTVANATSPNVHTGLAASSTHTYSVRAKNADGNSAYSSPVSATTQAAAAVPVALFNSSTVLEPDTTVDTPTALITRFGDRARDRHAREDNFHIYDHYLSWYWEQRVARIEIIDHIGKAGQPQEITFNYKTLDRLNPAEFRTFFRGVTTVAEYNNNQIATLASTNPSAIPGETDYNYTATISQNAQFGNRALQLGDRVEIEISQFLNGPRHGRLNYYGTVLLYIVGQGIVPWAEGKDMGFNGGVVAGINQSLDSYPLPETAWTGGKTTLPYQYSNEPQHRFKELAGNISDTNVETFMLGRRLHHSDFGDGSHEEPDNPIFPELVGMLGPRYVSRSCVACHVGNGRALPVETGILAVNGVMRVGSDATGAPHPDLGRYLQSRMADGSTPEATVTIGSWTTINGTYGDGTAYQLRKPNYAFTGVTPAYYSFRAAPQLVGLGLLEAVPESTITGFADPNDSNADGISGRVRTVTDPETGDLRVGRFGYKAGQARLRHQIASALNNDMGVTTAVAPNLDRGANQPNPGPSAELSAANLDLMYRYVALLGIAARRDLTNAQALQGEALFTSASCVKCHIPSMTTSPYHPFAELRGQTIHPYTDLLLHDMGAGLADNMAEGDATGAEWRTAPLWSIGLTAGVSGGEAYLHDGRARTITEAILWHSGEAEASKEAFRTMSASDRAALVKFLQSL